ncbi:MAG: NAD(P)-binding protein [Chloroflexi bacterium]|nr:NAD(P)-binding protein [Chloroflexota bacterium]
MSNSGVQVIVIGGGLGGLCLAQGLRQAGVHVAVYERDPAADFRSQGYRIGINADGRRALADCLPPKLFELFLATTSRPSNGMVILSAQSKEMVVRPDAGDAASPETFAANVNRLTLREILLAGLDDAVHFSKTFTHFEQGVDGGVRAWFADGSSVRGDVLVAADGVHSAIRQQLLPHAQVVDAGARVVFGKTPLTHESLSWIPPQLLERFTLAIGPNSRALALGAFRPVRPPADAAAELWPGLRLTDSPEYLMWTFGAAAQDFPLTDVELAAADGLPPVGGGGRPRRGGSALHADLAPP